MKLPVLIMVLLIIAMQSIGNDYWQQQVNTRIDVRLDDKTHFLYGSEAFTYINNSPDTLHHLFIHLWPNAYKNDKTAFAKQMLQQKQTAFYFSKQADRGFIDSLHFTVDGKDAVYYSEENFPDIARIELPQPLAPGQQTIVQTPFRVKIPKVFSRLGHMGQAYYITQWFPKPAVYDQKGWHPLPYLDQGEFYSNYGSYDVSITLPENYIVMGTGNINDKTELAWLDSLSQKPFPSDTLFKKSWPQSSDRMKTVHFHEDKVHDFAWFADKRWNVRIDTVTVVGNAEKITAYAAFLPRHQREWSLATNYLKSSLKHYSNYVGPYPYKTIKAVEGIMFAGGGMEYPTISIIDETVYWDLRSVITHEVGHNWFYGILGTNERDFPWMDEGVNSFYERKTSADLSRDPVSKKINRINDRSENIIYFQAVKTHTDQPLTLTAPQYTKVNYAGDAYFKPVLYLKWMESYMGKTTFDAAMHDYYETWKFRHPYPQDLWAIMQKHSSKPLDWLYRDACNTVRGIDFAIKKVIRDSIVTVTLRNNSEFAAPALVVVYNKDSLVGSVWTRPFKGDTTLSLSLPNDLWTRLEVSKSVPDYRLENSIWYRNRLLHKPIYRIGIGGGFNYTDKKKLYLLPAFGYNEYDHFMLGLLIHNLEIPESRFRYALAPMYSFNTHNLVGTGALGYSIYPKKAFREIMLETDVKSFHYDETSYNTDVPLSPRYLKIAPSVLFTIKEKDLISPAIRTILVKGYAIREESIDFHLDPLDSQYKPSLSRNMKYYGLLRYQHRNERALNPFNYSLEGQIGADFIKISLEGNIRIDYHLRNKSLYVRGFMGKYFYLNNATTDRYFLNTTFTGINDYLYDDTYLGRSEREGFAARQISIREGGFKIPALMQVPIIGRSDDLLGSINLKTDLPLGKIPVRLFFDAGAYSNARFNNPGNSKFLFDGGVEIYSPQDILTIYIPLVMSNDFRDYFHNIYGDNWFGKSIVFSLNLQNINWLNTPRILLKRLSK